MKNPFAAPERRQSFGEEIANSVSHGVGLAFSLAAGLFLLKRASLLGRPEELAGAGVFAATVAALYLASTLYHALPRSRAKRLLRTIEHQAIFLLIAGTYTPFALGVTGRGWKWAFMGIVWGLAAAGIFIQARRGVRRTTLSMSLYLGMGWVGLIAVRPLWLHLSSWGFLWLLSGGVAYTAGVAFYVAKKMPYNHFFWHLFVLAGTACHFYAVWRFALGRP